LRDDGGVAALSRRFDHGPSHAQREQRIERIAREHHGRRSAQERRAGYDRKPEAFITVERIDVMFRTREEQIHRHFALAKPAAELEHVALQPAGPMPRQARRGENADAQAHSAPRTACR
jgi:hypothetical protein